MFFTILVAFISLLVLVILHELGHFLVARRFDVKVEEFGIGLPPRIIGKRFGETIYSLNLLPLGAFVRLMGEEERKDDPRSFSQKALWQRMLIVAGGVIAFWIMAAILLSFLMIIGAPTAIGDEEPESVFIHSPRVQIVAVAQGSPAQKAGLKTGDIILEIKSAKAEMQNSLGFKVSKMKEVQELVEKYKGEEIILTIQRGDKVLEVSLVPRVSPPENEGPMGVALRRVALKSYPWWQAPWKGIEVTLQRTLVIVGGIIHIVTTAVKERGLPQGVEFMGPVGISVWIGKATSLGFSYYLDFIATIAIYLAIFNALPIPAVDGGKLFFLTLEGIRRKPLPQQLEQKITAIFFLILLVLLIFVSIRDIARFL